MHVSLPAAVNSAYGVDYFRVRFISGRVPSGCINMGISHFCIKHRSTVCTQVLVVGSKTIIQIWSLAGYACVGFSQGSVWEPLPFII